MSHIVGQCIRLQTHLSDGLDIWKYVILPFYFLEFLLTTMAMVIYNLLVFHIVPVVMLRLENLIIALLQFLIVVFDELSCVCDTVLLLREHLRFFTAIKIVVCLDRVSRIFKNLLPVVLPSRFSYEFGHVT